MFHVVVVTNAQLTYLCGIYDMNGNPLHKYLLPNETSILKVLIKRKMFGFHEIFSFNFVIEKYGAPCMAY